MSEYNGKWVRYDIRPSICSEDMDYSNPNQETTLCFVFEADCGGDSIALCESHLAEALERLRDKIEIELLKE